MSSEQAFDYIVVGAGASGCVIANRLTENPDCRVLLLEAGPMDDVEAIHNTDVPSMISLWTSPDVNWGYATTEQRHLNGRPDPDRPGQGAWRQHVAQCHDVHSRQPARL